MRARPLALAVAGATLAVLLGACSTGANDPGPGADEQPTAAASDGVVAGAEWGHIHTLALDSGQLLIGTHEGLWRQAPDQPPRLVSDPPFDVMGFAQSGRRMLASGHPGEGQGLPDDLGLRQSTDGGATWTDVSLAGQVDFHRLRASGDVVLGMSAHDGRLLRSVDGGRTWADLGTPALFDLAMDPADADHVVATTEQGPVTSADGGETFAPIPGAPLVALLAWTPQALYGVAPDGTVHVSTDGGATWRQAGQVSDPPTAVAAEGRTLVVLAGDAIVESTDGGATFTPRVVQG